MTEEAARALEHIAAGLRDGTFALDDIEMTQSANLVVDDKGKRSYVPSGAFTLTLSYKRKDI